MSSFITKTAWPMELVKPYGLFHILFFVIGFTISILLAFKLRNISRKKFHILLFSLGGCLFLFEIYKQLFYTYYIGKGEYQYWIFPFQLCSIPMYICLIFPFIKNEKIYHGLVTFLISYNLLGGFISFLEPSGLIHPYLTLTLHAFIWHMMVVFIGLLCGFNNNIKYKKSDFKYNIIFFLILCIIAFIINIIIKRDINMFFIGPNNSSIIVFKDISVKYGWFVNDLLYIPLLTLGAFGFYLPFTKIKKSLTKA